MHKDEHNIVEAIPVKFCHSFHVCFVLLALEYRFDAGLKLICQRLYLFGEKLTKNKLIGMGLIMLGVVIYYI